MIKNLGETIKQLKPFLSKYLEDKNIKLKGRVFRCPNFLNHNHADIKPSCNFLNSDKTEYYCYACHAKGSIFDAFALLENKNIEGENFFEAVKWLCNKYNVKYTEITSKEEQFLADVSKYLTVLVNAAHQSLQREVSKNKSLEYLLTKKQWVKSIDKFKLGYFKKPFISSVNVDILSFLKLDPTDLVGRLIIPIFNRIGSIIGITTRILDVDKKGTTGAAYMHYLAYNLKNVCYNLHNIDNTKEVIVVEGPSSVLTLYNYNITNVVATFGNIMSDNQYSNLVHKKIKRILFLYDGDGGGEEGLRNSLKVLCKGDIDTRIGFLKDNLDPGDYIIQELTLDEIDTVELHKYILVQYTKNTNDKYLEKCLMGYINTTDDLIKKEKLINTTAKSLKINKSTIIDLLAIYEANTGISTTEILKERNSLIKTLTEYERWSWSRGQMLGLRSFKSFDVKLDGVQNGFILVGGKPGIGKSALMISMAIRMLQSNAGLYILYFTIDDSMYTTLSRFLANLSELPINVISNPNFRIEKADLPPHVKKDYINRREEAITFLRDRASFFNLKDSETGSTIEMIKEKIKTILPLTQGKQLVVMLDNLHNLRSKKMYTSQRNLISNISNDLDFIANFYKCPIVASTHLTKEAIKSKVYDGTAVKDTIDLDYDCKLLIMLSSDEDDLDGTKEDMQIKVRIAKNKFSAFQGKIDMMFYRSLSKVVDTGYFASKQHKKEEEKKLFD